MNSRQAIVVLTTILAVAHAPLLLNDGFYADDPLNLKVSPESNVHLNYLLHGAGHPILYAYFSVANASGHPMLVMKLMAVLAIIFGAYALWSSARRLELMSEQEAVAFSLIAWTYPGYQLWAGKANAGYVFSFGLLCVGIWLLVVSLQTHGGLRIVARLTALCVFFVSFALNSIMALYLFVALGLCVAEWKRAPVGDPLAVHAVRTGWAVARRYPDFLLLPIVYWTALNTWFPREGAYLHHYAVHLPDPIELAAGFKAFFSIGYTKQLDQVTRFRLPELPVLIVMAFVVVGGLRTLNKHPAIVRRTWTDILWPVAGAAAVFIAAATPYLIAGLRPNEHFYETRHLILFGVPAALLALGAARAAGEYRSWGPLAVFGLVLTLQTTLLFTDYAFLQARWLKQEALIAHLKQDWPNPPALVFNLDDGFLDYPSRHVYFGISEVTGALRMAWGEKPLVGFNLSHESPEVLRRIRQSVSAKNSYYRNMDPSGPQATIELRPGPAAKKNTLLALQYYACRLLNVCDEERLVADLARVQIHVGPIPNVEPVER